MRVTRLIRENTLGFVLLADVSRRVGLVWMTWRLAEVYVGFATHSEGVFDAPAIGRSGVIWGALVLPFTAPFAALCTAAVSVVLYCTWRWTSQLKLDLTLYCSLLLLVLAEIPKIDYHISYIE